MPFILFKIKISINIKLFLISSFYLKVIEAYL